MVNQFDKDYLHKLFHYQIDLARTSGYVIVLGVLFASWPMAKLLKFFVFFCKKSEMGE